MGNPKLRTDSECQNCGHTVEIAYCSRCGQKNTETRQSFAHLAAHVVEDITHYDGAFWKTIKYLLLRPGRLTLAYLQGHRMQYVPPVKLYIFISFVTFFLVAVLPDGDAPAHSEATSTADTTAKDTLATANDSVQTRSGKKIVFPSLKELEAYQNAAPQAEKIARGDYWAQKINFRIRENKLRDRVGPELINSIPKVLFLYMPIFAFWLWLVHGKRRWYFFDHGIFTLHYFAALLLLFTIFNLVNTILGYFPGNDIQDLIGGILALVLICYAFFYFFRSHRRMYGEKRWVSRFKGFLLFFINMFAMSIVAIAWCVFVILNMH